MKPRQHELTAIDNRALLNLYPGDVSRSQDLSRWIDFRTDYHRAQQMADFSFPLQLDFEVNSGCNLRCRFCTHGYQRVPNKLLPFELYKKAIDEAARHGLCSVKLSYINEPLLNQRLSRYVAYAKERGIFNVYFATNGTLLTADKTREMIRAGVTKIFVSIDATTARTYKRIRNSNLFHTVVENVETAIRIRDELGLTFPLFRVNFLRTELNADEADDFVKYWNVRADMIGFQTKVQTPGSKTMGRTARFRCSFPFKMLVIDVRGDILPCCTFHGREMPLGNVATMTLEDAWNSKRMVLLKASQRNGSQISTCRNCIGREE